MAWYDQNEYDIRLEWGLEGAQRLSKNCDVTIVVDVLSFSTCVEIGVSNQLEIYPYLFKDVRASEFARSINGIYANPLRSKTEVCLSPASLKLAAKGSKVVLPSPNGSTISFSIENRIVLAGCLRNATAVARAATQLGKKILLIPAGEKWPDGSLRPSLEDLLGAGAIISVLKGSFSPEAVAAAQTFNYFKDVIFETLNSSSSGRELLERGYPEDNLMASEYNISETVPILQDRAYRKLII